MLIMRTVCFRVKNGNSVSVVAHMNAFPSSKTVSVKID